MRFITFQSYEVYEILKTRDYYANKDLAREGSFSKEDFDHCNGNVPVWIFGAPHLALPNKYYPKSMIDFFLYNCSMEMSLPTEYSKSLERFVMIELKINYFPPMGVAHNGTSLARVIPRIRRDNVMAVYKVGHMYEEDSVKYDFLLYKLDVLWKRPNAEIWGDFECTFDEFVNGESAFELYDFKNFEDYYNINKVKSLLQNKKGI